MSTVVLCILYKENQEPMGRSIEETKPHGDLENDNEDDDAIGYCQRLGGYGPRKTILKIYHRETHKETQ